MIFDLDTPKYIEERASIFNLDEGTVYLTEGRQKSVYEIEAELERLKSGKSTKFYDFIANCIVLINAPLIIFDTFAIIITCAAMALELWPVAEGKKATKKRQLDSLAKQCESSIKAIEKSNDSNKKQKIAELNKLHIKISNEYVKLENKSNVKESFRENEISDKEYNELNKKANEAYVGLNRSSMSNYIYEAYYQDYISNMITNEEELARSLNNIIPMNESAYRNVRAITEAKAGDTVKAKCNKFMDFIKNLIAKFMESLNSILLDYKEYLKKYEDIIKKKTPKAGLTYSCSGDYKIAISRCINTEVPIFDYNTYGEALQDEEGGERKVVTTIMSGKPGFEYDDGGDLSSMFKSYFLATDEGPKDGKLSELNFTDMYNFCYNSSKINDIVKKDERRLENSTNAIINAAKTKVAEKSTTATNPVNGNPTTPADSQAQSGNESTIWKGAGRYIVEYDSPTGNGGGGSPSNSQQSSDNKPATKTNLNVTNTDATSQMGSYSNDAKENDTEENRKAAGEGIGDTDGMDENKLNKMSDEWLRICRIIFAAKITAVENIAKDYMTIIRAHVRSYTGKKDDVIDNKTASKGTKYKKDSTTQSEKNKQQTSTGNTNNNDQEFYNGLNRKPASQQQQRGDFYNGSNRKPASQQQGKK